MLCLICEQFDLKARVIFMTSSMIDIRNIDCTVAALTEIVVKTRNVAFETLRQCNC